MAAGRLPMTNIMTLISVWLEEIRKAQSSFSDLLHFFIQFKIVYLKILSCFITE